MGNFFGMDSTFYKVGSVLADVLVLSFLWIICSIPIFTIGASTTALFYTTTKIITDREGYVLKDFFKSFRKEFLSATGIWIIIMFLFFIIYTTLTNMNYLSETIPILNGVVRTMYVSLQLLILLELCMFTVFVFPVLSRFEIGFKSLITTSFFMANRHLLTSVLCLLLFAFIIILGIYISEIILVVSVGLYSFTSSWLLVRVFKKYRPEIDSDNKIL